MEWQRHFKARATPQMGRSCGTAGAVLAGIAICGGLLALWGPLVFMILAGVLVIGALGTLGVRRK